MFTQKISMDCTKEQYEKYLKDELLKMGYKEIEIDGSCWADYFVIVNNFGELGQVTQLTNANKNANNRTYLGSFNAPLFLALAAMTDKAEGNYGEYYTNDIEFMQSPFIIGFGSYGGIWRKATKEEIMAKFGNTPSLYFSGVGHISVEYKYPTMSLPSVTQSYSYCNCPASHVKPVNNKRPDGILSSVEVEIIKGLKSKGYKILKPKTWEEI